MRNYIRAEIYRNIRRPYFINFTLVMSLLGVFSHILINTTDQANFTMAFEMGRMALTMPIYLVIIFVEMVTNEDMRNGSLKNVVSSGLAREKIVVGKLLASIVLASLSALIILIFYFGTAFLAFPAMEASNMGVARDFFYSFLGGLSVWIACLSFGTFLGLSIRSDFGMGMSYVFFLSIFPNIVHLVSKILDLDLLEKLALKLSLTSQLDGLIKTSQPSQNFGYVVILGLGYSLVFTGLTVYHFKKKDL